MLAIDLGDGLWAAYDARTASLYKVWRGDLRLEGAVYDYRHGPQPTAVGPAYLLRTGRSPWRLRIGGDLVEPEVRYRGHRWEGHGVVVLSELRHDDTIVRVEEEIRRVPATRPTVEWRYRAVGVPAGVDVEQRIELDSLGDVSATAGSLQRTDGKPSSSVRGHLRLVPNGETFLRARFDEPTITGEVPEAVDARWERLESIGCPSCHATEVRTVGPSLTSIAERYDADPDTIERLAAKVRSGGSGAWGSTVMPANDFLSQAEAEDLVAFILALDGEDAAAHRFALEHATGGEPTTGELLALAADQGPGWVAQGIGALFRSISTATRQPGDGAPLEDVHPSFVLETVRPAGFEPKVGGMDFLPNGDLLVSTWDPEGAVYRISGLETSDVAVERIATGLSEPLGLLVVDGDVYVLQKHELTQLVDRNGDGRTDEYRTVANGWGATGNFHEFAFGLVAEPEGTFLATLSSGVAPGGASAKSQPIDRGTVIRIGRDGSVEPLARGLRTPNGIGPGAGGEIYVTDNQGAWLPASKLVRVEEGAFYGFRDVDPEGDATRPETPPVVWLPQDEIGNSPSEPVALDAGPYRGQMLHGDVTHGGIKRVFVESVDGGMQGTVFRFSQGLEAGVNRLRWGPDGKLYLGGVGNPGNWGHAGRAWFGLQRLAYDGTPTFEMLAVRATQGGFEIEMTEPLAVGTGEDPDAYDIEQWRYEPTADYGGPKVDLEDIEVADVRVSSDRRRITLDLLGLRPGSVVHLRLDPAEIRSEAGDDLWTTETWYTLNRVPAAG